MAESPTSRTETLLQSSLQYRVVHWSLQLGWGVCIACAIHSFYVGDMLDGVAELLLGGVLLLLRYFALEQVQSLEQLDWLSISVLAVCTGVVLLTYQTSVHNKVTAAMSIMAVVGALMLYRGAFYWTWMAVFGVAYVVVSSSMEKPLTKLDLSFILIVLPSVGFILRHAVVASYRSLAAQVEEREKLVGELSKSLRESRERKTESESARKQLSTNEAKLNAILDRAPINLFVFDMQGTCVQAKGLGLRGIGFKTEMLPGQDFETMFRRQPELIKCCREALQGTSSKNRVMFDAGVYHDFRFEAVRNSQGEIEAVVGVSIDVSQVVANEIQRQAYERLQLHSHKMENLGLIAGSVAHDFNNYLTAIVSFSESILGSGSSKLHSTVEQIRQTALQAGGVADQMLTYSSQIGSKDSVEPLELNKLLTDMELFLRAVSPKSAQLEIETGSTELWIEGSELEIQQMLMNFLNNANDAIAGKCDGAVKIQIAETIDPGRNPRLRIGHVLGTQAYGVIEIRDNGSGISDSDIEQIANPYFTTKSDGHGFGMAIAKRIALSHAGSIEIEDNFPIGTCIRVLLPLSSVVARPDQSPLGRQESEESGGRVVLLVDDEQSVLDSVSMLLKAKGNKVIAVKSAKDAMEEMKQFHEEIDCLILDFSMPKTNGLELLNRVRAEGWSHPAILCSGYNMRLDDHPNAQFWPDETLAKPYKFNQLQQAMDKVCHGKVGHSM